MSVHCARRVHAKSHERDAAHDLSITHRAYFLSARTQLESDMPALNAADQGFLEQS